MSLSIPLLSEYIFDSLVVKYRVPNSNGRVHVEYTLQGSELVPRLTVNTEQLNKLHNEQTEQPIAKLREAIFNVRPEPGHAYDQRTINLHTYITLCSGNGFSKHEETLSLLNYSCPTDTTMIEHLKAMLPDLEKLATDVCNSSIDEILKEDENYHFKVSLDCAWSSKRDAYMRLYH